RRARVEREPALRLGPPDLRAYLHGRGGPGAHARRGGTRPARHRALPARSPRDPFDRAAAPLPRSLAYLQALARSLPAQPRAPPRLRDPPAAEALGLRGDQSHLRDAADGARRSRLHLAKS